ncbi:MAG: DUF1836 domain-containing protein [Acutalibacteraceae bacterium]
MKINDDTLSSSIVRLGEISKHNCLPKWDELPNIDLYMDQVIALVNRYLGFLCDDEALITHSMINNYVKLKIIPMPVKKRYCKTHLACLIMIGALKQSLSIPTISFLLPNDCNETEARVIYDNFAGSFENSLNMASEMVEQQVKSLASQNRFEDIYNLATDMAVGANIFKVFADRLLCMHPENDGNTDSDKSKKADKSKEPKQKEKSDKKAKADK